MSAQASHLGARPPLPITPGREHILRPQTSPCSQRLTSGARQGNRIKNPIRRPQLRTTYATPQQVQPPVPQPCPPLFCSPPGSPGPDPQLVCVAAGVSPPAQLDGPPCFTAWPAGAWSPQRPKPGVITSSSIPFIPALSSMGSEPFRPSHSVGWGGGRRGPPGFTRRSIKGKENQEARSLLDQ